MERKTRGSSFTVLPVVAPCSCVSGELHYFGEMKGGRGRWGVSNVCVMSKKGIKIKGRKKGGGAFAAEISLCFITGGKRQIKAAEMKINKLLLIPHLKEAEPYPAEPPPPPSLSGNLFVDFIMKLLDRRCDLQ